MFPELQTKDFTDFWTLPWDEFIVASDAHCPYVDEEIFERMLKIADKLKIKNFLHAGDFFNQDQFSIYDTCGEDLVDWADEIDYSRKIYLGLKSVFKEIRFFMGSHDLRFWKLLLKSGKELPFNSAFKQADIPQKDTSRYRYARINDEWHVTHPRNVIKINSTPALRLGAKVKRSIIFGHGHWWGQYKDPSASHYQIAPGCLVNSNKIAYARLWDTSHDLWTNGFLVVVEKNKPILFEKKSPWGLYLGKSK
jgi:predicted phosphodiesterase